MWIAYFETAPKLIDFWMTMKRARPDDLVRLIDVDGKYAAATADTDEAIGAGFRLEGGQWVEELPPCRDADLARPLASLPLEKAAVQCAPHVALFVTFDPAENQRVFQSVSEFPNDGAWIAAAGSNGVAQVFLIAVQGLNSWTPFQKYEGSRTVSIAVPADETQQKFDREALYVELGWKPALAGHFGTLWRRYGGSPEFTTIRLAKRESAHSIQIAVEFTLLGDAAPIHGLDGWKPLVSAGTPPIDRIRIAVERTPFYDATPPAIRKRELHDRIVQLQMEMKRFDAAGLSMPEPETLLVVPERAEDRLREAIRRLPDSVLTGFRHHGGVFDGNRLHFIRASSESSIRLFPYVADGIRLYRNETWARYGLQVFLPPDYRITPHLHFSQGEKIEAVLRGETRRARPAVFAFCPNEKNRLCKYILEEEFVALQDVLRYLNDPLIDVAVKHDIPAAVASFEERFVAGVMASSGRFDGLQVEVHSVFDAFRKKALGQLDEFLQSCTDLEREIQHLTDEKKQVEAGVGTANDGIKAFVRTRLEEWRKVEEAFADLNRKVRQLER